jgi:cytosine/adenosine deaminase-related metal-dependent hydrolase
MTPMQVIIAATKNAAEFLKMSDTGTLDVGKNADFMVLDANPLDDITNTRKISQVILRGRLSTARNGRIEAASRPRWRPKTNDAGAEPASFRFAGRCTVMIR